MTTFNATLCWMKFSQQTYSARTMGSKPCAHRTHLAKSGCLVSLTLIRYVFVINIYQQGFTFKHIRFMAFLCADGKTRRSLQVPPIWRSCGRASLTYSFNYNQQDTLYNIICVIALHVSGGFSAIHQELKNCTQHLVRARLACCYRYTSSTSRKGRFMQVAM